MTYIDCNVQLFTSIGSKSGTCSLTFVKHISLAHLDLDACAGFSEAKVIRDADISAQAPTGIAALKAKFGQLLGGSAGGDPFYAVLAYKNSQ